MIQLRTANLLAVVLLGVALGAYIYHDEVRRIEHGREAYLAVESHRFDRAVTRPHRLSGVVIDGVLGAGIFIGLYEALSAGIGKIVPGVMVSKGEE